MANEQELSKAAFNADVSKVGFEQAWQQASTTLKNFGVGMKPPDKLDWDPLAKMMLKNKKELRFVAQLVEKKTVKVFAKCGSESKEIMSTPLNAGKNDLWITDLTALKNNSKLFTDDELKVFRKAHPDQNAINKLKGELDTLKSELSSLVQKVKAKNAEIEAKKKAITDAGGKL